ncbi:MAG: hypothetical protein LLF96_11375 [Eubacteriales bacterium]|nr:hypothetical protein [Eubacteriales bacterium]
MKTTSGTPWKQLARLGCILLGGITAGFLLLSAVYALPNEPIARNVRLSVQTLDGSWETGEIPYEQLVKGYLTTQLDNSTDASMLLAAAYQSDLPLLRRVVESATCAYHGSTYAALLQYGQSGQDGLTAVSAARYWHGFLVFLKPLLCFLSYMDIRVLLMTVEQLMVLAVLAGFFRRSLMRFAPAFALALVCVTPAIAGFSLQFSTVFLLFLTAMLVLLFAPGATRTRFRTAAFFMVTGMATSYLDYFTYPIATFGMPFILYMLLTPAVSRREALRKFLLCLGAWLTGYLDMWAGKWVIAALLGGDPWFVANLWAKITQRSSYASDGAAIGIADVYRTVFGVFAKKTYLLVAVAVAAVYATLLARTASRRRKTVPVRQSEREATENVGLPVALSLTALLPLFWYALTANHSFNHAFFTSRALTVTVFAVLALATLLLRRVAGTGHAVKRKV